MNTISFESGQAFVLNSQKETKIEISSLAGYLNSLIEIDDKTTFHQLWKYIEKDQEFFSLVFSEAMGEYSISDYIEQMNKPGSVEEEIDEENHIDYLQCYWHAELYENKLDLYPAFDGVGPCSDSCRDGVDGTNWSIDFIPINNLKHYPIVLNKKVDIYDIDKEDINPSLSATKEWTVYDVLYCILYEISFNGSPLDQLKNLAKLDQIMSEVKDWHKNNIE